MPEDSFDRRAFLRTASLAALGVVVVGCSNESPGASRTPTPTGTASGSGFASPSPTPTRAAVWRRLGVKGPPPRSLHTFTANKDGSIGFLFGGKTKGRVFKDAWAYERSTGLWQPLPVGPPARFGHAAAYVDGHFVVFAGRDTSNRLLSDSWAFDPALGNWRQLSPQGAKPAARYGAAGTTIANSLTISHGLSASRLLNDTWALSKRWTDVTPKTGSRPLPRALHRVAYLSGRTRMLLFGGQSGSRFFADTWLYDPSTLTWSQVVVPGPSPRMLFSAGATATAAYLFGGVGSAGPLRDVWSFDGKTWRMLRAAGTPPLARSAAEGAVMSGPSLLLFGGNNGRGDLGDFWELTLPA